MFVNSGREGSDGATNVLLMARAGKQVHNILRGAGGEVPHRINTQSNGGSRGVSFMSPSILWRHTLHLQQG